MFLETTTVLITAKFNSILKEHYLLKSTDRNIKMNKTKRKSGLLHLKGNIYKLQYVRSENLEF